MKEIEIEFATLVKTDIMPKNVESYLITSVKNRCLNLLEHKEVRARFEQAYTAEKISNSSNQEPLPYGVFQMRHLKGMKYQDIANELGISKVMVYKHLTKAMTTIKEYKQKNR